MLYIETKPLLFSRKDIQNILHDKHKIFKRSNLFSWEYQDDSPPEDSTTVNIPLSFYEIGNPFKLYNTECLVEGPNLALMYFRTPTLNMEKNSLNKAIEYVETHIESPHKEVLLKILKEA